MIVSQKQYDEHRKLYVGYISKTAKLLEKPLPSREWKKDFNYNYAGARLHALYFEHLEATKDRIPYLQMPKKFCELVAESFGSYQNWNRDFQETAKGCRPAGWAFMAINTYDGRLYNILTDSHDASVVDMVPLIVLDMYEHSYFIDYGTDKEAYIKKFINSLDWNVVYQRLISVTK